MEQECLEEAFWKQGYQEVKALHNNEDLNKALHALSSNVDADHPYGGQAGHQIFLAYSDRIIKPSLTYFLKKIQDLYARTPLSKISFENLVDSVLTNLGEERLFIANLTNKDARFGRKLINSTQNMQDPIHDKSFPAWNHMLQTLLQNKFQSILTAHGQTSIEKTLFLEKLDKATSGTIVFVPFGGNSLWLSGGMNLLYDTGGFVINLSEKFLDNITEETIKACQHKITFYHVSYIKDFYKIITPDFQKALLWNGKDLVVLKTYLARILFTMAHSSTFMRGQAAITEWLLASLSLAHGYQLKWSNVWTSPQFPSPDQHALSTFDIGVFINNFIENAHLVPQAELSASL